MKREYMLKIIRQQYKKLVQAQRRMVSGYEVQSVHDFRIAYKKLKASLSMMASLEQQHELAISKKLKKAFRLSGIIRDLQLQLLRVSAASKRGTAPHPEYTKMLLRNMEQSKQQLSGLLSQALIAKSERKSLAGVTHGVRSKDFRKLLEKKWANIQKILNAGSFKDARLHKIRKKLKELSYIRIFFPDNDRAGSIPGLQHLQDMPFRELSEKLGNFQDQCNAIRLLPTTSRNHLSTKEKKGLKKKKKLWLTEKKAMKRSLLRDLELMPG